MGSLALGVGHGPAGQGQGCAGKGQADGPLRRPAAVPCGDGEAVSGPAHLGNDDTLVQPDLPSQEQGQGRGHQGVAVKGLQLGVGHRDIGAVGHHQQARGRIIGEPGPPGALQIDIPLAQIAPGVRLDEPAPGLLQAL